ncbi:MAG: hypothetical protein D6695_12505 [Planctomycetota bacterium]|nr:MAG: hypothetical protein D6695_12505 [Planctomycetota bacterium]
MRLVALVLVLLTVSCSRVPNPELPSSGPRLVVLSPALAVILKDIGAGELVVGRHNYDMVFPDLPACGQQGSIDYEQLIAVAPTDILIEWGAMPLPKRLKALASANDWTIHRYELKTLDDILLAASELEARYAPRGPDEPVAARCERAWARRDHLERAGRVLLLAAVEPPTALGPGSFHAELLERLGATPAVTDGGPWIELGLEDIVRMAPDAIVLVQPRKNGQGVGSVGTSALEHFGPLARLHVPAVENERLAVLDAELYHTPSTATIQLAEDLASVLERWACEP